MFKMKSDSTFKPPASAVDIIAAFGTLPILADINDGKYRVVITDISEELASNMAQEGLVYFQRISDKKLVWCGCWMDWPEKEWDIHEDCYYDLPREDRAMLEATEQLEKWVHDEFDRLVDRSD